MTMLSKTAAAMTALLLGAAPALALAQDGPIASARPVDTTNTDAQIRAYLDAAAAEPTPGDEAPPTAAPAPDKQPHGEFGVGIGSGGYRQAYAATVVPVGDIGTAAIAVSDTRFNGRFGPRKQQSLSIGVALGDAAKPGMAPGCLRDRPGRGPEPMWVTRMRADQGVSAGAACLPR
jgi:hypothetical protein